MNPEPPTVNPAHPREHIQLATEVAEYLRPRLLDVAREVAGPSFRPTRLVEALGIDKDLASAARLVRSQLDLSLARALGDG